MQSFVMPLKGCVTVVLRRCKWEQPQTLELRLI